MTQVVPAFLSVSLVNNVDIVSLSKNRSTLPVIHNRLIFVLRLYIKSIQLFSIYRK
jgi:hypothetical protein